MSEFLRQECKSNMLKRRGTRKCDNLGQDLELTYLKWVLIPVLGTAYRSYPAGFVHTLVISLLSASYLKWKLSFFVFCSEGSGSLEKTRDYRVWRSELEQSALSIASSVGLNSGLRYQNLSICVQDLYIKSVCKKCNYLFLLSKHKYNGIWDILAWARVFGRHNVRLTLFMK